LAQVFLKIVRHAPQGAGEPTNFDVVKCLRRLMALLAKYDAVWLARVLRPKCHLVKMITNKLRLMVR